MRISGWLFLLEQFLAGFAMMMTLSRLSGVRMRWGRCLTVSLGAAGMALGFVRLNMALRFLGLMLLSAGTAWMALPGLPRYMKPRAALCAMLLGLLYAAAARWLNGVPLPALVLSGLIAAFLMTLPRAIPKPAELPRLAAVDVRCGAHRIGLTALIDSGNLLRDAVTGLPVVVISQCAASRLVALPSNHDLAPGMRLMPVRTISGTTLMVLFRPDETRLCIGKTWQTVQCLIGVSPGGGEGFQALVPASLLNASSQDSMMILEVSE